MDKLSINATHIFGFFLPGFTFVFMMFCSYHNWSLDNTMNSLEGHESIGMTFVLTVLSLVVGLFFDAIRNGIIENILDKKIKIYKLYLKNLRKENKKPPSGEPKSVNWDFFSMPNADENSPVTDRYFRYYLLDVNIFLAIIFGDIYYFYIMYERQAFRPCLLILFIVIAGVFLWDALDLREEIYYHTNTYEKDPSA